MQCYCALLELRLSVLQCMIPPWHSSMAICHPSPRVSWCLKGSGETGSAADCSAHVLCAELCFSLVDCLKVHNNHILFFLLSAWHICAFMFLACAYTHCCCMSALPGMLALNSCHASGTSGCNTRARILERFVFDTSLRICTVTAGANKTNIS